MLVTWFLKRLLMPYRDGYIRQWAVGGFPGNGGK
jgi:hypothetical protein